MDPVDESARTALLVALALSTLGDVFLLGDRSNLFVAGLASFLLAHLAYVAGFWLEGVEAGGRGRRDPPRRRARRHGGRPGGGGGKAGPEPELAGPVRAYVRGHRPMVASAVGDRRTRWPSPVPGCSPTSDSLIAWERFVRTRPWADLAIMVTYHLAQLFLVVSLQLIWRSREAGYRPNMSVR